MLEFINIILLAVAAFIFYRLYTVLGKRPDGKEDNNHYDIFSKNKPNSHKKKSKSSDNDNVISLPTSKSKNTDKKTGSDYDQYEEIFAEDIIELLNATDIDASADKEKIEKTIRDINKLDRSFNSSFFINGAKYAYEQILTNFANGELKALKPLLSDIVYKAFEKKVLDDRNNNHQNEFEFIGIQEASIMDASLEGSTASMSVKFASEIFSVTSNDKGEVVSGDNSHIQNIIDIWTFKKDIKSRNPNWILSSTSGKK